jgi:hypothetical protein
MREEKANCAAQGASACGGRHLGVLYIMLSIRAKSKNFTIRNARCPCELVTCNVDSPQCYICKGYDGQLSHNLLLTLGTAPRTFSLVVKAIFETPPPAKAM